MKRILVVAIFLAVSIPAQAVECPEGAKSCKVLVISDEQASVIKQMISNTSVQGPYSQVKALVDFYSDLIDKAPAGESKKAADPVTKK